MKPQLHLGLMSPQEIADWFGVTKKSYSNTKKAKLEILKQYCDFIDTPRKGIIIKEIYQAEYVPPISKKEQVRTLTYQEWPHGEYNQANNVGKIIHRRYPELKLKEHTCQVYVHNIRTEDFGNTTFDNRTFGKQGRSKKRMCKLKYNEYGEICELTPFNSEEQEKYCKLIEKYYKIPVIKAHDAIIEYQTALEKQNITEEDLNAKVGRFIRQIAGYGDKAKYWDFKKELNEIIGCPCEYGIQNIPFSILDDEDDDTIHRWYLTPSAWDVEIRTEVEE